MLDEHIDPEELENHVPFGRSRFLKSLGALVFGSVIASCGGGGGSSGPCEVFPFCKTSSGASGCSGTNCTIPGCTYDQWQGCKSGGQCWTNCYQGKVWTCCDYNNSGAGCICATTIGSC